jgi:hypothetical protein
VRSTEEAVDIRKALGQIGAPPSWRILRPGNKNPNVAIYATPSNGAFPLQLGGYWSPGRPRSVEVSAAEAPLRR